MISSEVTAVTFNESAANDLSSYNLNEIIFANSSHLENYNPLYFASAFEKIIDPSFNAILFAHTYEARDWVPRLSARLDSPFISDCINVNSENNLIKGGGGALLMEKIVASCSNQFIIIADSSKIVSNLGKFPLPVEVVQFGSERIKASIERFLFSLGYQLPKVTFRRGASNKYVTDQHNYILDLHLNEILDPKTLSIGLLQIVGVVEVGLFIDMASKIIIGNDDGSCKVI